MAYARAPHYINAQYMDKQVINAFWINPFQRIWHGEFMDDLLGMLEGSEREEPICVWIWNAHVRGAPQPPPCATKFKCEP